MGKTKTSAPQPDDDQDGSGMPSNPGRGPQSTDELTLYITKLYQGSDGDANPEELLTKVRHFCMAEAEKRAGAANDRTAAGTQLILSQVRWKDAERAVLLAKSQREDAKAAASLGSTEYQAALEKEKIKWLEWMRYLLVPCVVLFCLGVGTFVAGVIGGLITTGQTIALNLKLVGGGLAISGVSLGVTIRFLLKHLSDWLTRGK